MARDVVTSKGNPMSAGSPFQTMGGDAPDAINLGRLLYNTGNSFEVAGKVNYSGQLHLVTFGPNGSGKSTRVLVPNLLSNAGKSIVVIDPKGQLTLMTALWRKKSGNDVQIIDPFGVVKEIAASRPDEYGELIKEGLTESAGFNPLPYANPASPAFYEDVAVIAEALIKMDGDNPHWPESARNLLTGLLMWEIKTKGKNANLENVRRMLTEADDVQPYTDNNEIHYRQVAGLRFTANEMLEDDDYALKSLASKYAALKYTDEIESIRSTAETQTRWILSETMRTDLKKPGVDFRKLKDGPRPMTVYVVLPSKYLETHSVWLRCVISEALRASLTAGGRKTLFMLEEFAALGHLSMVSRLFGTTRDYRVQMWPIFQDLPQLQSLYKNWETILGMAGVVQGFRTGDFTTANWMSQRSGQDTGITMSHQRSFDPNNNSRSSNLNYNETAAPFIRSENFFGLPTGASINWFANTVHPIPVFSPRYDKIAEIKDRAKLNPYAP